MAHAAPPSVPAEPVGTMDELMEVWERFRTGGPAPCPADGVGMALAVDAAAGVYRFVCTQCGTSSAWFETSSTGLRLRGTSPGDLNGGPPDE